MYNDFDYNRQNEPFEQEENQFTPPFGVPFGGPFGQPFGQPGSQFPPFGPPFGDQFGAPFGPQGGQFGPPSGPPPAYTPQQAQVGVYAVDPGAIRRCRFRFTYIWLTTGQSFWAWLVFVGRRSVSGWRWTGYRWVYFGIDLDYIASFQCY